MSGAARQYGYPSMGPLVFRVALFAAAASLAIYIPIKYATNLHAMQGLYGFLFPLSGILALAGMVLAIKPRVSCSCGDMDAQISVPMRAGVAAIAVLWLANGILCVPTLAAIYQHSFWGAAFAAVHLTAQHIFLSLSVIAFTLAPYWMTRKLGLMADTASARSASTKSAST